MAYQFDLEKSKFFKKIPPLNNISAIRDVPEALVKKIDGCKVIFCQATPHGPHQIYKWQNFTSTILSSLMLVSIALYFATQAFLEGKMAIHYILVFVALGTIYLTKDSIVLFLTKQPDWLIGTENSLIRYCPTSSFDSIDHFHWNEFSEEVESGEIRGDKGVVAFSLLKPYSFQLTTHGTNVSLENYYFGPFVVWHYKEIAEICSQRIKSSKIRSSN